MDEQSPVEARLPDPAQLSQSMADIAERSQRIVSDFFQRQGQEGMMGNDPMHIANAFFEMTTKMMRDPTKLVEAQMSLWQDYMSLWQNTMMRAWGQTQDDVVHPEKGDRRFKDPEWSESAVFDYIKQSYLLSARWINGVVADVDGLDEQTKKKVDFYTRQFTDALAPTNFAMTNPEVVRTTLETGGENLVKGLQNMLGDLERGKGKLSIRMTDMEAFELGKNIATTPGKVVFRNELIELVQYTPTTEKVRGRPIVISPPWINKFYILDLREKNSFVKWAVDQGNTVFMISWVNPDEKLAGATFEDYMTKGVMAAVEAALKETGADAVNAIGYCLGGTLLSSTLAYMNARGDERIKSATFFTTMTDFTDAGELTVFIDEEQLDVLEERMNKRGYLDGAEMSATFNMLRANDLIWSFVVNNYLLGKDPFPFDLLYWNSDNTRMPAAMHSFYLRKMYQENQLAKPGGIKLAGEPIDLGKIKTPCYFISTIEDHIAPWKATYAATQTFGGPVKFVLSGSGHIAGVVNPPAANKYGHWTNTKKPQDPDKWLEGAKQVEGSWWPDWDRWIKRHGGTAVEAREPGKVLGAMEDAPGTYVKVKAGD